MSATKTREQRRSQGPIFLCTQKKRGLLGTRCGLWIGQVKAVLARKSTHRSIRFEAGDIEPSTCVDELHLFTSDGNRPPSNARRVNIGCGRAWVLGAKSRRCGLVWLSSHTGDAAALARGVVSARTVSTARIIVPWQLASSLQVPPPDRTTQKSVAKRTRPRRGNLNRDGPN